MRDTQKRSQQPFSARGSGRARRAVEFVWQVENGYDWIETSPLSGSRSSKEPYLVGRGSGGGLSFFRPHEITRYRPLERDTGLFKNFASVKHDKTAIQEFAGKYGNLGISVPLRHGEKVVGNSAVSCAVIQGESLDSWNQEINAMHQAVELRDAVSSYQRGSQQDLRRLIQWRDPSSVICQRGKNAWAWIATPHDPELLEELHYPDLIRPALRYLQRIVNEKLLQFSSGAQLLRSRGELRVFIRPPNLLAAMWLQFALAIEGDRQYRTCEGCGRWFEVGGGQKRADSETCNSSCRKRRERIRKAAEKPTRRSRKQ